jgi:hypothetical protein
MKFRDCMAFLLRSEGMGPGKRFLKIVQSKKGDWGKKVSSGMREPSAVIEN